MLCVRANCVWVCVSHIVVKLSVETMHADLMYVRLWMYTVTHRLMGTTRSCIYFVPAAASAAAYNFQRKIKSYARSTRCFCRSNAISPSPLLHSAFGWVWVLCVHSCMLLFCYCVNIKFTFAHMKSYQNYICARMRGKNKTAAEQTTMWHLKKKKLTRKNTMESEKTIESNGNWWRKTKNNTNALERQLRLVFCTHYSFLNPKQTMGERVSEWVW